MHLFPNFMSFIAVQSVLVFGSTLLYIRKYITPKYYWVCLFLLLATPGLFSNWISAMRTSLAAVIIWITAYFFLQRKTNYILYFTGVVIATFFHTSAAIFIVIPILNIIIPKLKPIFIFGILIAALFVGYLIPTELMEYVFSSSQLTENYGNFYEGESYSLNGMIFKAIYLIPAFFIYKYNNAKVSSWDATILSFVFLYLALHFSSLDFQHRYTCYIFNYFAIAIAMVMPKLNIIEKMIIILPLK